MDYSANANNLCRLFPSTGKNVCYEFRNFYDAHSGAVYFGQPISNTEMLDGRLVQYFERARMEWYPERPYGQRVVLTPLGLIYIQKVEGIGSTNIIEAPENLDVSVFMADPSLGKGQKQTVFIRITRKGQPVGGLSPMVTLVYPDETEKNFRPSQKTDQDGVTSEDFSIDDVQPNQVIRVEVEVQTPDGSSGKSGTWFRTWW
jgi:hypothetical protein